MNNKLQNLKNVIANMNQNNINNFNNYNNNINKTINWNMNNNKMNNLYNSMNMNNTNIYNNNGNIYNNMNIFNNNSNNNQNNYYSNNFMNSNNFIIYSSRMKNLANQNFSVLLNEKYIKLFPLISFANDTLPYFNSFVQCLLHIPELNIYFSNYFNKLNYNIISKSKLSKEYFNIVNKACNNLFFNSLDNKRINLFSIKNFSDTIFSLNPQLKESKDEKDLLIYIIKTMHNELNYFGKETLNNKNNISMTENESFNYFIKAISDNNFSIFSYLFYGIFKSVLICMKCYEKHYFFGFFPILNFSLRNFENSIFNIYQGFKEYIKPNSFNLGKKKYYCLNCNGLDFVELPKIFYTPPILIINLDFGKNKKYKPKKFKFGEIIDLTGFIADQCNESTYELIAALCIQKLNSGNNDNYISYCKDKNNIWHRFDNTSHNECNFDQVESSFPKILFYKKENSI